MGVNNVVMEYLRDTYGALDWDSIPSPAVILSGIIKLLFL